MKDSARCYHCDHGIKKKLSLKNVHIRLHEARKSFCNILVCISNASKLKRFWMLRGCSKGKNVVILPCISIYSFNCVTVLLFTSVLQLCIFLNVLCVELRCVRTVKYLWSNKKYQVQALWLVDSCSLSELCHFCIYWSLPLLWFY